MPFRLLLFLGGLLGSGIFNNLEWRVKWLEVWHADSFHCWVVFRHGDASLFRVRVKESILHECHISRRDDFSKLGDPDSVNIRGPVPN